MFIQSSYPQDKDCKVLAISYCGLQMSTEIDALKRVTSDIIRPITCIIEVPKFLQK